LAKDEVEYLEKQIARRLPPVTSLYSLSLLFGFSPRFVMAMVRSPARYYRRFEIQSGRRKRQIHTPMVALKVIQRWFGYHLSHAVELGEHVHGFVPERSTVTAAREHCPAKWVLSLDIRNFFGSVTAQRVFDCLSDLGYTRSAAHLMTDLCTMPLEGGVRGLPQGAPSSPVLANLSFRSTDEKLESFAQGRGLRITRYADDISVSGHYQPDPGLPSEIEQLIQNDGWVIAQNKTRLAELPKRSPQVLGLLVDQAVPRLPKRYRNRLRMMRHMLATKYLSDEDRAKFLGHLAYAESVR
jgi:RNA-directed DNA polymerase